MNITINADTLLCYLVRHIRFPEIQVGVLIVKAACQ